MIELYYSPGAASLVVHWLLIDLGLPHRLHPLDFSKREQKDPGYLAINPAGVVPTLVMDGRPVTEAAAIVMHLADIHPQAKLAPPVASPERANFYQWMCFMANTLQPAYRAWFYPEEPAGADQVEAAKAQARARIEAAWTQAAAHLERSGPYLLGDSPCAADFMMTMLMRWSRNMPRPADSWPSLAEHARRMKARPSFGELYAREGLSEWT